MKRDSRAMKVGDALSQLINVAILPDHHDTNANESISGRAYRCGWTRTQWFINRLFWWDRAGNRGHCELADGRDVDRARELIESLDRR